MKQLIRTGILISLLLLLCIPVFADSDPAVPEYEEITYGLSGAGRELKAYRYGSGENVLVLTFAMHGYEDNFDRDGMALVKTAEELMAKLDGSPMPDAYDWTIYIIPCVNPDGLYDGWTNYGPGRCTTTWIDSSGNLRTGQGIDMNRCFPTYFQESTAARNRTTSRPMACLEARALDEFIRSVKGDHDNVLIDVHGWLRMTISKSSRLASIFQSVFPENTHRNYEGGNGYFTSYACSLGYETCLLELPGSYKNLDSFLQSDCVDRVIQGVMGVIKLQPCICDTEGHNYITEEKAPTCTASGYKKTYCPVCADTSITPYVTLGHTEDPETVVIDPAPTATKDSLQLSTCSRCGSQLTKTLKRKFSDINPGGYYAEALDYCYAAGYISGTGESTFSPDMKLSRGMLITMLYRMEGEPEVSIEIPFIDVPADQYYHAAVVWAYNNAIASGTSSTKFSPNQTVTREQAMAFFFRYIQYLGLDNGLRADPQFNDASRLHSYALEAARWSVANGIICGDTNGNLMPLDITTRAQAVTILKRAADYVDAQQSDEP